MTMHWFRHHISCRVSWWNTKSPRPLSFPTTQMPCNFWLFPKLNIWKGRDFKSWMNFRKIQWGCWWQLSQGMVHVLNRVRVAERTVWGPKVPTLKGTEASLSCVYCLLYLVYSSKNVYFSHYITFTLHYMKVFCVDLVFIFLKIPCVFLCSPNAFFVLFTLTFIRICIF